MYNVYQEMARKQPDKGAQPPLNLGSILRTDIRTRNTPSIHPTLIEAAGGDPNRLEGVIMQLQTLKTNPYTRSMRDYHPAIIEAAQAAGGGKDAFQRAIDQAMALERGVERYWSREVKAYIILLAEANPKMFEATVNAYREMRRGSLNRRGTTPSEQMRMLRAAMAPHLQ